MTDRWTGRLSEYLDGDLSPREARRVERHLDVCPECAALLQELRAVVARARTLTDRPPATDLWPGIEARLHDVAVGDEASVLPLSRRSRPGWRARRFSFSAPQLAAAALALVLLSGTVVWRFGPGDGSGAGDAGFAVRPLPAGRLPAGSLAGTPRGWSSTAARYEAAIAELEEALLTRERTLDPVTIRTVRHSLEVIDRAIEEARRALQEDPSDPYLNQHVAETMRRKVELLQEAVTLRLTGA
ncbi:MAG: anti-sigma factor family protein [Gemmatimonadota bacterium]